MKNIGMVVHFVPFRFSSKYPLYMVTFYWWISKVNIPHLIGKLLILGVKVCNASCSKLYVKISIKADKTWIKQDLFLKIWI